MAAVWFGEKGYVDSEHTTGAAHENYKRYSQIGPL